MTYLAFVSGRSQYLKTSHAPSLFLALESMNSACTLIRAATFFGSAGLGVYGMGAMPHLNSGLIARLKMPFIPTLPVRNDSWPDEARMVFSSAVVGHTLWRSWRSTQYCRPRWKLALLIV